jgi:hypothetical protein
MSNSPSGPVRLLIVGGAVAAVVYLAAPYLHAPAGGNLSGPNSYDEYGWKGDPRRFDQSRRGGYSDFYPGPRTERPASPPVARQQMHLDESLQDPIEDRRGERHAPQWDVGAPVADARGLACWDKVERRRVDPAFCSREGRR